MWSYLSFMRFEDIPMLAGGNRITGHLEHLRGDRLALMKQIADQQLDMVRIRFPAQTVVAANGTQALYDVLVGSARHFEKSPVLRCALYPLAGDGLFTSEGSLWRRQRKLMSPMFRQRALEAYASDMASCAERATDDWGDARVIDAARETTRIAMSVAGKTLFDADTFTEADELGAALTTSLHWVNEQVSTPTIIAQARLKTLLLRAGPYAPTVVRKWMHRASEALLHPILWPGKRTDELNVALAVLESRVERMIAARRSTKEPPKDLLTQLLQVRDDDGTEMSDKQVRDEILTLFVAGHETTASALAWALYLLARHPNAYATAQAEVDALHGEHVTLGDLPRLPFCLKVFKESLRMYAPIYLFGRQAMDPVMVGGYELPRGTIVLICPLALHHRSDLWPEPDRFDPERFTPEAEAARPREAYLPFSGGPRTCIGNHFALMEGPIVLATLLRRMRFELTSNDEVLPEASATLRPLGGIPMRVTRQPDARTGVAAAAT
jgi:cytochrome P450